MTDRQIAVLVSKGKKLARKVASLEAIKKELDHIKSQLRDHAGDESVEIPGRNGDLALVKQYADSIARVVPSNLLERVTALAGKQLLDIFNLAPAKGDYVSFEVNALRAIGAEKAAALDKLLRVPSTA